MLFHFFYFHLKWPKTIIIIINIETLSNFINIPENGSSNMVAPYPLYLGKKWFVVYEMVFKRLPTDLDYARS